MRLLVCCSSFHVHLSALWRINVYISDQSAVEVFVACVLNLIVIISDGTRHGLVDPTPR